MKATKPWNNRRFIGTFDVENTTKGDSGRYRCIVHSDKGVGVSNYGELTIKREYLFQSRKENKLPHNRPSCLSICTTSMQDEKRQTGNAVFYLFMLFICLFIFYENVL